jgi:hypothetical protein
MTKIGEGGSIPQPSGEVYHKSLQEGISKFENALIGYQIPKNPEEGHRLRSIMDQQMELIQSSINEIKRLGIHKQGDVVKSDYNHYMTDPSEQNLTALQQDLATLKEYNVMS